LSWRFRIEHRSLYRYAGEVASSYNEARITPLTAPGQLVLESTVTVRPRASCLRYVDYWGTVVHAFDLHVPHSELEVVASSLVEKGPATDRECDSSWTVLDGRACNDLAELLAPTEMVPAVPELLAAAASLRRRPSPKEAALGAIEWVHQRLEYVPGSTGVRTSAIEALAGGRGVCQDFAHVSLGVLRGVGLPARYCSGYVHPSRDAALGSTSAAQSHAWVEYWAGSWVGLDPTVVEPAGSRHVLVARGRDYRDVSPLIGIYHGARTESLEVAVLITRLA
jgi:transglutaminase-like putative cysteine protease